MHPKQTSDHNCRELRRGAGKLWSLAVTRSARRQPLRPSARSEVHLLVLDESRLM